jgi:8-oxo-dGTP pyrophosphatase MutT (NUDIX family)
MSAEAVPIERRAARVLLIDDQDRVLLFEGFDPEVPDVRFWFTAGGGVEPGESLEQAARRELREETGCTTAELGPAVWTRATEFSFNGQAYSSDETFFLARVPSHDVDTSGFVEIERQSIVRHRWWTPAELAATDELVYPARLGELLTHLLRHGAPATPVALDG